MTSRSKFVVGTVNGKRVAYIVDQQPRSQNRSSTAGSSRTTTTAVIQRPASTSMTQNDLEVDEEDDAHINGTVTLSQNQLRELLELLERHRSPGYPSHSQEAWLSSASSCDISLPNTPGPSTTSRVPSAPNRGDENCSVSSDHDGSGHARVKASFIHSRSYDSDEIPTRDLSGFQDPVNDHFVSPIETRRSVDTTPTQNCMKPPLSLLEQKKLQWAKERAELEGLCAPWGRSIHPDFSPYSQHNDKLHVDTAHSSLPIITTDHALSPNSYISDRDWRLGGYRSADFDIDSRHLSISPPLLQVDMSSSLQYKTPSRSHSGTADDSGFISGGGKSVRFTARTPGEGEEQNEDRRSRWGDKGVGVGHLWEPSCEPNARLPDPNVSPGAYPAWLERGLSRMGTSPVPSETKNFLRGQNVPLDPAEMEERERKRQKALEHHKAIKQQLEERERKRIEEKELRLLEERREEERVRREQELERCRIEQERRKEQLAKEAKEAKSREGANKGSQDRKKDTKMNRIREADKPINLSPRIVDLSQRPKQTVDVGTNKEDTYRGNSEMCIERGIKEMQLMNGHKTSRHYGGGDRDAGMMMVGQEVAVLLAPELEERLLHSRAARDQATQTECSSQQTVKEQRGRKSRQTKTLADRPQWGAHRSNYRYVKQSDKDVYRQRGSSVGAISPHQQRQQPSQQQTMQRAATVDSTEESDRSPPVYLTRRKAAQNSNKVPPRRCHSSDEDSVSPTRTSKQTWGSSSGHVQVWSNPAKNNPPALYSPASILDLQEPVDYFDVIFNPPLRATNSPPVPAVAKKMESQPELYKQPPRREPSRPPLFSPPVPAVMHKLQETEGTQLPSITAGDAGNKSAPPAVRGQNTGLLPDIKTRDTCSAALLPQVPQGNILSQLSTLRKVLQTKQSEWELRSETPFSES